jgi:hypothetical protein
MGAQLVRQVASKTNDAAGDGTYFALGLDFGLERRLGEYLGLGWVYLVSDSLTLAQTLTLNLILRLTLTLLVMVRTAHTLLSTPLP